METIQIKFISQPPVLSLIELISIGVYELSILIFNHLLIKHHNQEYLAKLFYVKFLKHLIMKCKVLK